MALTRWCLILSVIGCWIGQAGPAVSADLISECMQTGRGTYMEDRWNLVAPPDRERLCRYQETDRQKADRVMREWQEEQRRLREGTAADKGQQEPGTKTNQEPGTKTNQGPAVRPEGSQAHGPTDDTLGPCARPDAVGECRATSDQILYQIKRSKENPGGTNR
jgi:hypothetical protein